MTIGHRTVAARNSDEKVIGQKFMLATIEGELIIRMYAWELLQELSASSRLRISTARTLLLDAAEVVEALAWRAEEEGEVTVIVPPLVHQV